MGDLDLQYRDFGHYIVDYLAVQEADHNTDQEEAIERMMTTQSAQGARRNPIYRTYGEIDSDTSNRRNKKIFYGDMEQCVSMQGTRGYRRCTYKEEPDVKMSSADEIWRSATREI